MVRVRKKTASRRPRSQKSSLERKYADPRRVRSGAALPKKQISPVEFMHFLRQKGFSFFSGVPDSTLKSLFSYVERSKSYVPAAQEGQALGLAHGAHLGRKKAVVFMQNAGLGNIVNPHTSLSKLYKTPCLLVIGWRGQGGKGFDAFEHDIMGRDTLRLLKALDIPATVVHEKNWKQQLTVATRTMARTQEPVALVIRRGLFSDYKPPKIRGAVRVKLPVREEVIRRLGSIIPKNAVIVSTTGFTTRELFTHHDRPGNFYMAGSMGQAAPIALGRAIVTPKTPVYIFDGDGALIMNMGVLSTIGNRKPRNLTHVVFDNMAYDSTGQQRSTSPTTNFAKAAIACGYRTASTVKSIAGAEKKLVALRKKPGPHMLVIEVAMGHRKEIGRIDAKYKAPQVTRRVRSVR